MEPRGQKSIDTVWCCCAQTMAFRCNGVPFRHPEPTDSFHSRADRIRDSCATGTSAGTLRSGFSEGIRLEERCRTLCMIQTMSRRLSFFPISTTLHSVSQDVGFRNLLLNYGCGCNDTPQRLRDKFLFPGCRCVQPCYPNGVSCSQRSGLLGDPQPLGDIWARLDQKSSIRYERRELPS